MLRDSPHTPTPWFLDIWLPPRVYTKHGNPMTKHTDECLLF
jgi:hypothetical protein